jgi:hypothetical protein
MAVAKKAPVKNAPIKKAAATRAKAAPVAKKAAKPAAQKAPVAAPRAWDTIHIFGYGETQLIGSTANGKIANSELKSLAALYTALAAKQQKGTKITAGGTHALNIFNGSFIDFRPMDEKNASQRIAWIDADVKAVNKLADELISKVPAEEKGKRPMGMLRSMLMRNNLPGTQKSAQAKTRK